jgi:hypothetical protein
MSVRFQDETSTFHPSRKLTPSLAAKTALTTGLEALHPHLCDNEHITGIARNILQLFFSLKTKEKSKKKFDDESFIPTSCRFLFKLKGTSRVCNTDEFQAMEKETKDDLDNIAAKLTSHMKKVATLEIKMLQKELMTKTMRFSDLIVKQQLLSTNGTCRGHQFSNELTIKVFDAAEGDSEETIQQMKFLSFDATQEELRLALTLPATIAMTQATGPTTSELAAVAYARKALKNTLSAAFLAYQKSNESLLKEREIKEILFEALTTDKADDIAIEIDQDCTESFFNFLFLFSIFSN